MLQIVGPDPSPSETELHADSLYISKWIGSSRSVCVSRKWNSSWQGVCEWGVGVGGFPSCRGELIVLICHKGSGSKLLLHLSSEWVTQKTPPPPEAVLTEPLVKLGFTHSTPVSMTTNNQLK